MNKESHSDDTMIFGMKVKVVQNPGRSKTYLSIGLLCMALALAFHLFGMIFQGELVAQMASGHSHNAKMAPEMQAWIRTCSILSFVCLWLAVLTVFHVAFQHRKALQAAT